MLMMAAASLIVAMPLTAGAQSSNELAKAAPKATTKETDKVREMNFDGDLVEAQWLRPDQGVTDVVLRPKKSTLINVRANFTDEILKSADDL